MRDFDRRFNRMRKFVIGFIVTVFVAIVAYYVVVILLIGKVVSDPEKAAEKVGEFGKKVKDGWEQGFEVRNMDESDTISIDSLLNK